MTSHINRIPRQVSRVVGYRKEYRESVPDLMHSRPFKKEIWNWQFIENPFSEQFNPVILIDQWNSVIGFNGVMPVKIKIGERVSDGIWSCDFFVDSRYRGMGIGKKLKKILNNHSPIIMALGISDMASPVLLGMGWRKNCEVETFHRIQRFTGAKSFLIYGMQILNRFKYATHFERNDYYSEYTNSLPDGDLVELLWERVANDYNRCVVRNYSYLHWKYECHPLAKYGFITAESDGSLMGILVIRVTGLYARIVDYLGPAHDMALKAALLEEYFSVTKHTVTQSCITSDKELKKILLSNGFRKMQGHMRFYIHSSSRDDPDITDDWFIMGGDSDGDMLEAAEDGPFIDDYSSCQDPNISVKELSEEDFLALEDGWNNLLKKSDADPLFLDWTWQITWWRQWSKTNEFQLFLLAAYTDDNKLVGLAPLYKCSCYIYLKKLHYRQIQFIGSSWGSIETVRTEYLDFIVDNSRSIHVRNAFLSYLDQDLTWDQFIFSDINRNSITINLVLQEKYFKNTYRRIVYEDFVTYVNTYDSFSSFLSKLGRNTRYRLINRRNYLHRLGEVTLEYADQESIDDYFVCLNNLHSSRWGEPCFAGSSLSFHKQLAKELYKHGCLRFSKLSLNKKPISILYDFKMGNKEYNIQTGFDERFGNRVSVGLLHIGMVIESACGDKSTDYFDLLAGPGKHSYYKAHFGSKCVKFNTVQINRSYKLKKIYKLYDYLSRFLKRLLMG
ncbi:MAG: GNAT family N-acetyltransferase [Gammaproteobacteria bacterium]